MKKTTALFLLIGCNAFAQNLSDLEGTDLFGGIKARHIGPALMSGRVSDIEGHPQDSKTVYIGTAGGGVWKSQDGGVMFNSIFDQYCQSIGTVKVDPNDPDNTVWVGTGEIWTRNSTSIGDGIYLSKDGGKNWKKMGLENSERISSIQIDPKNSQRIFVGVLGALWGDSEDRGVYKTEDGGATWEKILYVGASTGCTELIMDSDNPNTLYASFWEFRRTAWSFSSGGMTSAMYKSTDGGKTWEKIHKGLPDGKLGRIAMAMAPSDHSILYAVVESEDASKSGMYRSDDAGKSWTHLNSDFGLVVRPFYFSRIVVHPTNPDVVVKAGLFGSISKDGGKTFRGLGPMHPDIHDIWFDHTNPDKLFAATDGGLYRSLNLGETMEMIENLPICQFYHVSVDNQTPYNIYGGLQDNGSWFGPSASPGGIEARDWEVIGVGDGFRVYPHPTKPHIMYSEMQGAEGVWRYDHKIRQTREIKPFPAEGDPKLRFNWNAPITTSPNNPDRLYIGSQFVYRSEDMGNTWTKISPDLTTNDPAKLNQAESGGISKDNSGAENHCTIFSIAESPLDQNVIWVGTDDGNVQISKDGGKTWENVILNLFKQTDVRLSKGTWCYHIEASQFDKGTAYVVFDGHTRNDKKTYVYKVTDFGKTWKDIATSEINGFARSLQEDLKSPDILYLGTEFGLYVTITGGQKWMKFENNMPSTAVHYIEMHPKTNDLILGTHGRGIIILDDMSKLRQITPEVASSTLSFLKSDAFELNEESTFGGTSTETQFVGGNPATGVQIAYFMNKRHTFGKMSMSVYDSEGKFVTSLTPGKQKGLNVVNWNFNGMAPKTAAGKTFSGGSMSAPTVMAGKYKVVIEKGKETFETTVEVKNPANSMFTESERKLKNDVTMKLYTMNEQLAYAVYEIDENLTAIQRAMEANPKLKKAGDKALNSLNALKADMVITTGDNYVGRAENELREDLGEIYGAICNNFGPPTASQLDNVKLIENRMTEVMKRLEIIRSEDLKKFNDAHVKAGGTLPQLKTYEEFVKKD